MRKIIAAAVVFSSALLSACVQPPADQRELSRVHWLPVTKEIIQAGDLADYQNVATQLNLRLQAKEPIPATDVDGKVIGENVDVNTIPSTDTYDKDRIWFHYGFYQPNDKSFKRAILTVRNLRSGECISVPDIYKTFGYVRGTTYPHSATYSIDYHFKGVNAIDLYLTFDSINEKCAEEIAIFQNRWK